MKLRKAMSFWLPILVLIVGVLFILFTVIEYRQNVTLIDENQALISESARTLLKNNLIATASREDLVDINKDYDWVKRNPNYYLFQSGKQVFPWFKGVINHSSVEKAVWKKIWSPVNHLEISKLIDSERLQRLLAVKKALESGDERQIKESFDLFIQHQKVFILSPMEEIAFSLKLVELGLSQHWNPQLVEAFLLTGGSSNLPITRPVLDWLFKYHSLFSEAEFFAIVNKIQKYLEQINLSNYFLNEYLEQFGRPAFVLTNQHQGNLMIIDGKWLIQNISSTQKIVTKIQIKEELKKVTEAFFQIGVLQDKDVLQFTSIAPLQHLDELRVDVQKAQLNKARHRQNMYLITKIVMLIAFTLLVLAALRMMENNQRRRLEYINLKEDFVKLVGHELKTPLSGIRVMAETLKKRVQRGLDTENYPERIINESDKLWHMVDNILNFNRMHENTFELEQRHIVLKEFCDVVVKEVVGLSDKKYQVHNDIQDEILCYLDAELFSLVIKNLLVNAALYNDHADVVIHLSFQNNTLNIRDNGIGIEADDHKNVFDPFVRLPQHVRRSGTGLGLALCRKIVFLHDGEIAIADSSNQGTLWQITINPNE